MVHLLFLAILFVPILQYLQIFCNVYRFSAIPTDFLQNLQIFCNTCRLSATLCRFSAIPVHFLQPYLDLRHYNFHTKGVSFTPKVPRKTGSADKPAEVFFACFDQEKKLCTVKCFRQCLKLSRNVRPVIPSSLPDKLFISFRRPYKPVTCTTLGRWLRTFMSTAEIDSQIFKAHSVLGVSTTAAGSAFVPLSTIMSMSDWSST